MQNLLSNALKFHREGAPLHVRVRDRDAPTDGRCVIAVEDNGIGFDEKYAERIFGTFQRLHGRAQYEGTGIGLSIARKIAWRHDGDITATGRARRGRDVPADAAARSREARRRPGRGLRPRSATPERKDGRMSTTSCRASRSCSPTTTKRIAR